MRRGPAASRGCRCRRFARSWTRHCTPRPPRRRTGAHARWCGPKKAWLRRHPHFHLDSIPTSRAWSMARWPGPSRSWYVGAPSTRPPCGRARFSRAALHPRRRRTTFPVLDQIVQGLWPRAALTGSRRRTARLRPRRHPEAQAATNALCRQELRLLQNLFLLGSQVAHVGEAVRHDAVVVREGVLGHPGRVVARAAGGQGLRGDARVDIVARVGFGDVLGMLREQDPELRAMISRARGVIESRRTGRSAGRRDAACQTTARSCMFLAPHASRPDSIDPQRRPQRRGTPWLIRFLRRPVDAG